MQKLLTAEQYEAATAWMKTHLDEFVKLVQNAPTKKAQIYPDSTNFDTGAMEEALMRYSPHVDPRHVIQDLYDGVPPDDTLDLEGFQTWVNHCECYLSKQDWEHNVMLALLILTRAIPLEGPKGPYCDSSDGHLNSQSFDYPGIFL
jgi:hypothetical protein